MLRSKNIMPVMKMNNAITTKTHFDVNVTNTLAIITINQTFTNDSNNTIEAIVKMDYNESICPISFSAIINDKEIFAKLKEKSKAKAEYERAITSGERSFLVTTDDSRLEMNIGNLLSKTSADIKLVYITILEYDEECLYIDIGIKEATITLEANNSSGIKKILIDGKE